ncbi:hypothetical protein ABK040_010623 [Willaertia magna]
MLKHNQKTKLFSFGINEHGQLARLSNYKTEEEQNSVAEPVGEITLIKNKSEIESQLILQNIKEIASGRSHTVIITLDNELYGAGYNNYNQLGFSDESIDFSLLQKITLPSNVKTINHVACGWFHTIVVCDNHRVFAAGHSYFDQTFNVEQSPAFAESHDTILRDLENINNVITHASCNTFSSTIVINGWKVITCGEVRGQFNEEKNHVDGCEIFRDRKIKYLKHSDDGVFVLTEDGTVFFTGKKGPFTELLTGICEFSAQHMLSNFYYLKQRDFTIYRSTTDENNDFEDTIDTFNCLQNYFEKSQPKNNTNLQIYAGYSFTFIIVNKKIIYKLIEEGENGQLELIYNCNENGENNYFVKDIISGTDTTHFLLETCITKSEVEMKRKLFKNVKFCDVILI